MKVLVINAGSSSLKYQLFDTEKQLVMAKGLCERIGIDGVFKYQAGDCKVEEKCEMQNHAIAIQIVIKALINKETGVVADISEIEAVGHRVVHGGESFKVPTLIDKTVIDGIKSLVPLAPLHNPGALSGINACLSGLGENVPQVAVFDTAFHQSMPEKAFIYPLPYEYYTKYQVRRYGFHGTSHEYVANRCAALMNKPIEELRIITCHLGNGSSIAAVKNGKVIDTTMGFTPLEGLPMGTRVGFLDPAVIPYILEREGGNPSDFVNTVLNKKSGALGVSGVSSDYRDIEVEAAKGNAQAQLALDQFSYCIKKFIGAYAAAMSGVDAIVFTAGVGENNCALREQICEKLCFMGITLNYESNKIRGKDQLISEAGSKVSVYVIPTNEELMIAEQTQAVVNNRYN